MRFKDFLKESIIDIPRKTYARPVFDNADTSNPKLKPSVRKQVLDGIQTFTKFGKVVRYVVSKLPACVGPSAPTNPALSIANLTGKL